ncbi:hypothetical protein H2200_000157 [Cladophialophora chaetospira]|uniref:Eukaryotic translation initiation factor 2A n=1 Tax=Cladophialophora chaetospira TaxID=386627 RepID=A0AA38XNY6_9EURO|nr:hypothetical protein H2200_000157 [Cladophialophora chaetospira]
MLIKIDGKATRRPVLSPDGKTLAVIAPDDRIHLIDLAEAAQGRKFVNGLKITKSTRPFIWTCSILRWSPEVVYTCNDQAFEILSSTTSECDFGRSWLLLSDGKRVIAVSTDLRTPKAMSNVDEEGTKSNILADYDLGDHLGKISLLEFVLDHRHALVFSEFGSSAAILNLTRPQRDDIPYLKFSDVRSLAQAPDSRYFALLRRDKAQDKVTVFQLGENNQLSFKSFNCNTSDAQNVTWCPTGQPLIAVWDSPTYGVKVSFFTAQGHALNQLEIGGSVFQWTLDTSTSEQIQNVGLTYFDWKRANRPMNDLGLQLLANDQRQVLVRYQSANSMTSRSRARITHPESIDGSKACVWLESSKPKTDKSTEFLRQAGAFEVEKTLSDDSKSQSRTTSDSQSKTPAGHNQVDLVELNSTHSFVATRLQTSPRMLFLWRSFDTAHPQTVLIFRHAIRQVHFHPILPNVLVIVTNSKNPRIYAWYQPTLPPIAGLIPIDTSISTNFSGAWLPHCIGAGAPHDRKGALTGDGQRCPFLFTSNTAFEAGYLSSQEGRLMFESILQPPAQQLCDSPLDMAGDESTTELVDTPSRPSKQMQEENGNGVIKKARFDVPEDSEARWKEDPIHEQAAYGHAW